MYVIISIAKCIERQVSCVLGFVVVVVVVIIDFVGSVICVDIFTDAFNALARSLASLLARSLTC